MPDLQQQWRKSGASIIKMSNAKQVQLWDICSAHVLINTHVTLLLYVVRYIGSLLAGSDTNFLDKTVETTIK